MAKSLREKRVSKDVRKMIGNVENLCEIWDMLDICYERPDKDMLEAMKPIFVFRRYKMPNSAAIRGFYFLLRTAIKGARMVAHVRLLINDQGIPSISM